MKLVPQSLFARLIVALLGATIIALAVIGFIIVQERRNLSLWRSDAWDAAASIAETSAAIARLGPDERIGAIERLRRESLHVVAERRRGPPPRSEENVAIQKAFVQQIGRRLGDDFSVTASPSRRGARYVIRLLGEPRSPDMNGAPGAGPGGMTARLLDVTVALPDGDKLVFRTLAPQPPPPLPRHIFVQLGIVTLVLTIVLYLMTRTITRPLSQLARAADQIGRGGDHPPLAEKGARELRDATRAFNTMHERLQRYIGSRTRVLAAMSHDLRTPLTRMRLRAESIEDQELRGRFSADLDEMAALVSGALRFFRDLNDDEAMSPVDVDALLATLQTQFAETGAEVTVEGRSNGPIVAKPLALRRCLTNLLQNAIQYGASATVIVADGAELAIRIRDRGPGIPSEARAKVFEPFFRMESSRSRDTGGTGLGLSIARDIVQAHGGSIELGDAPGGGLEVLVRLPRTGSTAAAGATIRND